MDAGLSPPSLKAGHLNDLLADVVRRFTTLIQVASQTRKWNEQTA